MALEDSSGRGVSNSYGPRSTLPHLDSKFKSNEGLLRKAPSRFKNAFLNELPTRVGIPYDRNGSLATTSVTASGSGASIAVDLDRTDHTTGLPMAKVTIPIGNTSYQSVEYYDLDTFYAEDTDVWMTSIYVPVRYSQAVVQILVAPTSSISGTNYTVYTFDGVDLQKGYNLLKVLHVEDWISNSIYGRVGTNTESPWTNGAQLKDRRTVGSVQIRLRLTSGAAEEAIFYIGAVHRAPANWSRGCVMWMADDVPRSFYDLAIPVIESFGWKATVAATSAYAGDPLSGSTEYTNVAQLRDLVNRGHEVWNHTRLHDNLDTSTLADKTTSLTAARDFWNAQGISTAARFIAYPFGAYDDETITLLKSLGYKLGRTIVGQEMTPWVTGVNPFTQSAYLTEVQNSWKVDAMLNGMIQRGGATMTYMHTAIPGGTDSNTYPGSGSFYVEHLRRWCELVKEWENQDRVIVCTPTEYYKLCGIDPYTDAFAE